MCPLGEQTVSEVHLRLTGVTIEHLPWQQFLKTYDKPGTLFFLDPPYNKAPYYQHNFELADYKKLAEALSSLKSHFILSINDHPEMRRVFSVFKHCTVQLTYTSSKNEGLKAREILVTN